MRYLILQDVRKTQVKIVPRILVCMTERMWFLSAEMRRIWGEENLRGQNIRDSV